MNLVAGSWVEILPGLNLIEALAELAGGRRGWVQATGHVEDVELQVATAMGQESHNDRRTTSGRFTLVSLMGPNAGPFTAMLARAHDGTTEMLGGVLLSARSSGVLALVTLADEVPKNEGRGPRPAPPKPQASGIPAAWVSAVRASALREASGDEDDDRAPQEGDLVEHFAFGLCAVVRADGDRLHIRDFNTDARVREVSTTMLKVMPPIDRDGKLLYRLLRRT